MAAITSASGFALSSDLQNASSSAIAARAPEKEIDGSQVSATPATAVASAFRSPASANNCLGTLPMAQEISGQSASATRSRARLSSTLKAAVGGSFR